MTYADTCPVSRFIFDLHYRPLTLRLFPDPVLRHAAHPVETIDRLVPDLARDMLVLMHQHRGIGLAAPQVGILRRIIVTDDGEGPLCLVNPIIIARDGEDRMEEGCLSLPDLSVEVARSVRVEVRASAPDGKPLHFQAKGLHARVLQHEIDHLNGALICDYAPTSPTSAAEVDAQQE